MIRNQINGEIVTSGEHFVSGKAEIAINVTRRLKMFFGEFFLDRTDGTKIISVILGKSSDVEREQEIRHRILTADGVLAITKMSLSQDKNRKIHISVVIATPFGQVEISESF